MSTGIVSRSKILRNRKERGNIGARAAVNMYLAVFAPYTLINKLGIMVRTAPKKNVDVVNHKK